MKYKLHIAYANREDLAKEAVESVLPEFKGHIHLWPNGENPVLTGLPPHVAEEHVLPPLSPISVINMMIQSSWHDDVMFWMHNDAYCQPGVAANFLSWIEERKDEHFGVAFTNYDVLCAFNMRAVREIGYWDPMFFQYVADDDYYHRLEKAGWFVLDYPNGAGVLHRKSVREGDPVQGGGGSNTVMSDPVYNHRVQFRARSGFDGEYYKLKWGGLPGNRPNKGREQFDIPFQDFIRANESRKA